jgi:competence protein ComEC
MDRKIVAIAFTLLLWSPAVQAEDLTVFFLDVGEGEAIYFEGDKKILVDTGNVITGHRVARFLEKRGVSELDAIVVTHPHPDHMGGVFHVLQHVEAKSRYDNGQKLEGEKNEDTYRWYRELFRDKNYKALRTGDNIPAGDIFMEVLWPDALTSDWNTNSLVLKVTFDATSLLLMGDANTQVETALLKKAANFDADVLKVGHHGASDSSSGEFLDAGSPEFAVISIDKDNVRGYPDPGVIKRAKTRGIKLLFTYKDGDIVFSSNGEKVKRTIQ